MGENKDKFLGKWKENDANMMHGWSKISKKKGIWTKLEAGDSLFVAGNHLNAAVELYGGRNVPEKEDYNIYRLKDGAWEVLAENP